MISVADKLNYQIKVSADVKKLRHVLMHRPDNGIEKVTPGRALDLLYEDIVYLPRMIEEHDLLSTLITKLSGDRTVIEFQKLLQDILLIPAVKHELLYTVCKIEGAEERIAQQMETMPVEQVASALITGSLEWKKRILLFPPLPNLIFCRDLGAIAKDLLIVGQASRKARRRETVLSWFIFRYHLFFEKQQKEKLFFSLASNSDELIKQNTESFGLYGLEGGDLMMLAPGHLLVGSSERTSPEAIQKLIRFIRTKNSINRISVVQIPHVRSYMHLDTIFTPIDQNECVGFEPLVSKDNKMIIHHYEAGQEKYEVYLSMKTMLLDLYPDLKIIACGKGEYPFDEREQWTDGCNLFSVRPGVSFVYERNTRTLAALKEQGYEILTGETILKENTLNFKDLQKIIVTIPSSELSRARGGPHCLTMPLSRD